MDFRNDFNSFKDSIDLSKLSDLKYAIDLSKLADMKDSLDFSKVSDVKDSVVSGANDSVDKLKAKVHRMEGYAEAAKQGKKLIIAVICLIAIIPLIVFIAFKIGKKTAEDKEERKARFLENHEKLKLKRQEHFAKIKALRKHDQEDEEEDEIFED